MLYEMKMPDLATTGSEIRVVRWMIAVGGAVRRGQPILEIETDKATMEVEATTDGTVHAILALAGETVEAGQVIANFVVDTGAHALASSLAASSPAPAAPLPAIASAPAKPGGMFARNRAAASEKPWLPVVNGPAPNTLSPAQLTAGRRMVLSKQTIPHFYLQTSFSATRIVALRTQVDQPTIVWDAFFVHAIAKALKRFDRFKMQFDGDVLRPSTSNAIGIAVDADGELYVIPVANAADRIPAEISAEIRDLAARVRSGDPAARRLPQVAMTVTNLGSCNVESFIPIINPPECAILGIGKIAPACVAREGQLIIEERGMLTLAADHRIVNGKYAGDFLGAVVAELEQFTPPIE